LAKKKDLLNPKVVSLSLASVFGIVYIVCALFHGFNMMAIAGTNMMLGSVVFGLIEMVILGLLVGWLFAVVYNALLEKAR